MLNTLKGVLINGLIPVVISKNNAGDPVPKCTYTGWLNQPIKILTVI